MPKNPGIDSETSEYEEELEEHELSDEVRFAAIENKLNKLSEKSGDNKMHEKEVNVFNTPAPFSYGGCHDRGDGFGLGGGLLGGLVLGSLFRNGGFGNNWGGDGVGAGQIVADTAILNGVNEISAAVPLSACQTQGAVSAAASGINTNTLQQTIAINNEIARLALGAQQGFAGVKDSVQLGNAALATELCGISRQIQEVGCDIKSTVLTDGAATRQLITQNIIDGLRAQLEDQKHDARSRGVEVNVTQQVTQLQAQQQQQAQLQGLIATVNAIVPLVVQNNRATQDIINLGTMAASGNQANTQTNVR